MSESKLIIIPNATLFGAALFKAEPDKFNPEKSYYSVWAGFPKEQAEDVIKQVLAAVGLPSMSCIDKRPFKAGDAKKDDGSPRYGTYADGQTVFTAKSKFAPSALLKGKDKLPLTADDIYPGAKGAVLVRPYSWQKSGSKGISLTLLGFWLQARGTRLEIGGGNAAEEFEHSATSLSFEDLGDLNQDLF